MKLGIVSDEIARDFASALRVGVPLGLGRYEIRHLAAGRAPMCGEAAMLEVERMAREEGVEITALSPADIPRPSRGGTPPHRTYS